jgi:hypothetical protein
MILLLSIKDSIIDSRSPLYFFRLVKLEPPLLSSHSLARYLSLFHFLNLNLPHLFFPCHSHYYIHSFNSISFSLSLACICPRNLCPRGSSREHELWSSAISRIRRILVDQTHFFRNKPATLFLNLAHHNYDYLCDYCVCMHRNNAPATAYYPLPNYGIFTIFQYVHYI